MPTFMLIAQDEQGGPIAIRVGTDHARDELYREIETVWGWEVLTGSARLLSLTEARREALQTAITTHLKARPCTLEELVGALREEGFKLGFARARAELHRLETQDLAAFRNMTYSWTGDRS